MGKSSTSESSSHLLAALRERLSHNERYLAQSLSTRAAAAALSYGAQMSRDWLRGEDAAVTAENEWIRATLRMGGGKSAPALVAREIPVYELNHHD